MASNIFNDANGTTLAAKDPKWIGNTTLLEMQGGELQVTNASLFNDRFVAYSDGQPNAHESEVELAAGCSFADGEILEVTCQYTSASVLYSARVGTTDVVLRRNGSYVDASAHGMNLAVAGNKVRIACDPATGSVQIYVNNTLLGIAPYTDGSPLTGGLPGFYINVQGNAATTIRLLSWSDGIAGGAPVLDSRGSLRPTRVPQRRPGRGPYNLGSFRRPPVEVIGYRLPSFGAVGLAPEADAAFSLGSVSTRALGLASETDTAFALAGVQARAAGRADESDTALTLAGVQLRAVGRADESDTAVALSVAVASLGENVIKSRLRPGRGPYSVGRFFRPRIDVLAAPPLVASAPVGTAAETDTAFALTGTQLRVVGLASESDTALALAAKQIRVAGLAIETDTALALITGAGGPVGVAIEVDSAFALAAVQRRLVGRADESDHALALQAPGGGVVGLAFEIDTAFALSGAPVVAGRSSGGRATTLRRGGGVSNLTRRN